MPVYDIDQRADGATFFTMPRRSAARSTRSSTIYAPVIPRRVLVRSGRKHPAADGEHRGPSVFVARLRQALTEAQLRLHLQAWHLKRLGTS